LVSDLPSIFETASEIKAKYGIKAKRPLAEDTLKRVARGIDKFVINNPELLLFRHMEETITGTDQAYISHYLQ
jgi:hypothetical protein